MPSILSAIPPDMLSFVVSFVFMFAVMFALLVYSGIFAKKSKEGAVVERAPKGPLAAISAVIAFVAAIYQPFTAFLTQIIPIASIVFVVLFFLVFLQQLFKKEKSDPWPAIVGLGALMVVLGAVWPTIQAYVGTMGISPDMILWGVGILVIIAIFVLAYSAKSQPA